MQNNNTVPRLSRGQVGACRQTIREGSKSFYFASLVLPKEVREAAFVLYSFCRVSDDLADSPNANRQTIELLKRRLEAIYSSRPDASIPDLALMRVVIRYDIPQGVLLSMLEGFEWDVSGRQYYSLSDVVDYSARVAGTVGVMMTIIMGRRSARTLARASELGVAMQLTNIARDVGEDARNGRLYLPRNWMLAENLDPDAFLANPVFTPALGRVVERLLIEADHTYRRSLSGISDLPIACRPGIRAAGLVYAEIGNQVKSNGFDSVNQRARTSGSRKLFLLFRALACALSIHENDETQALRETAYLVRMAAQADYEFKGTGEWFMDLISELNHRDHSLVLSDDSPRTSP